MTPGSRLRTGGVAYQAALGTATAVALAATLWARTPPAGPRPFVVSDTTHVEVPDHVDGDAVPLRQVGTMGLQLEGDVRWSGGSVAAVAVRDSTFAVSDDHNHDVVVWRAGRSPVRLGGIGQGQTDMDTPGVLAITESQVVVADRNNGRLQFYDIETGRWAASVSVAGAVALLAAGSDVHVLTDLGPARSILTIDASMRVDTLRLTNMPAGELRGLHRLTNGEFIVLPARGPSVVVVGRDGRGRALMTLSRERKSSTAKLGPITGLAGLAGTNRGIVALEDGMTCVDFSSGRVIRRVRTDYVRDARRASASAIGIGGGSFVAHYPAGRMVRVYTEWCGR